MPALNLSPRSYSSDIPDEALLYDEGPGFGGKLLSGLANVAATPQHLVLSGLAGTTPFTEKAPWSFDELLDLWGVGKGAPLDEASARIGKGAIWGLAGAVAAAPFTGGLSLLAGAIFAGLSQFGEPPKHTRELLGQFGELMTDPLMYLHIGRTGVRASNQYVQRGIQQAFTRKGAREVRRMAKGMAPAYEHLPIQERLEQLARASERTVIEGVHARSARAGETAIDTAQRLGYFQKGGARFQLPYTDIGLTIPGTPKAFEAIGKGVRERIPESIKRAFGLYGPEMKDVIYTYLFSQRELASTARKAINRLGQQLKRRGLDEEMLRPVSQIVDAAPVIGFDEALKTFMPAETFKRLKPGDVAKIKSAVHVTKREFARARKAAGARGVYIDAKDFEIERALARKQVALHAMKDKEGKDIIRKAEANLKGVEAKIQSVTVARRALAAEGESAIHRAVQPMMAKAIEMMRAGKSAAEVSRLMAGEAHRLKQGLPKAVEATRKRLEGLDSAIARLEGAREGLTEETQRALQRLHAGEDASAVLSREIQALHTAAEQRSGFFPLVFDAEARKWMGELAANPTKAAKVLDEIAEILPGKKRVQAGEGFVDLEQARVGRELVETGIELETRGGAAIPTPRKTTPHARQRKLKKEIQRAATEEEIRKATSPEVRKLEADLDTLRKRQERLPMPTSPEGRLVLGPQGRRHKGTFKVQPAKIAPGKLASLSDEELVRRYVKDLAEGEIREFLQEDFQGAFTLVGPGGASGVVGRQMVPEASIVEEELIRRIAGSSAKAEKFVKLARRKKTARLVPFDPSEYIRSYAKKVYKEPVSPGRHHADLMKQLRGAKVEAAGTKGIGIYQSLRSDELKEIAEGVSTVMGRRTTAHKLSRIFLSKENAANRLKWKGPQIFNGHPIEALGNYYQKLGAPVALNSAMQDISRRFGQQLTAGEVNALKNGGMPGKYLLDDIPGMENVALDVNVAFDFRRWYRNVTNPVVLHRLMAPYVKMINYWKQMALAWPAFHGRNYQSGIWQSMALGGMRNPLNFLHGLNVLFARGDFGLYGKNGMLAAKRGVMNRKTISLPFSGEKISYRELRRLGQEFGIEGPSFWQFEYGLGDLNPTRTSPLRIDKQLFRLNAWIGNGVEHALRYGQFTDLLKQGFSPREASKVVAHTHFLYESLPAFEREYLRKYAYPFWAWTRFNVPRTIESAVRNPGLYNLTKKLREDMEYTEEMPTSPAMIPDWVRRQMGIHMGVDDQGNDTYFLLGNFFPASDVVQLIENPIGELISGLSPLARIPYEMVTGKVAGSSWEIERFPHEEGMFHIPGLGDQVLEKRHIQLIRAFRWANEADRLLGPTAAKREIGGVASTRAKLIHAILGYKVYTVDRSRIARGSVYRNLMEIRRMRGLYMRHLSEAEAGDPVAVQNAENIMRWLKQRGVPPPTEGEVGTYLDRRVKSQERLDITTQRAVAAYQ